jgi:iron-sulfur cluster assembly protein
MTDHIVNLTEDAKSHIKNTLQKMKKTHLVFGLQGGGCAGFEYFWLPVDANEYDEKGTPDRDDIIDLGDEQKFIVDCTAHVYVIGSTIDYKTDFISSSLVVENPNASGGCGCGTSVSF